MAKHAKVTNVTQHPSGNWIEWEVESARPQGRLYDGDSIWVELRRVSRILIDFILSTVKLSPFRLVLLVLWLPQSQESLIYWIIHLFSPSFPWCPHFTPYSASIPESIILNAPLHTRSTPLPLPALLKLTWQKHNLTSNSLPTLCLHSCSWTRLRKIYKHLLSLPQYSTGRTCSHWTKLNLMFL